MQGSIKPTLPGLPCCPSLYPQQCIVECTLLSCLPTHNSLLGWTQDRRWCAPSVTCCSPCLCGLWDMQVKELLKSMQASQTHVFAKIENLEVRGE